MPTFFSAVALFVSLIVAGLTLGLAGLPRRRRPTLDRKPSPGDEIELYGSATRHRQVNEDGRRFTEQWDVSLFAGPPGDSETEGKP